MVCLLNTQATLHLLLSTLGVANTKSVHLANAKQITFSPIFAWYSRQKPSSFFSSIHLGLKNAALYNISRTIPRSYCACIASKPNCQTGSSSRFSQICYDMTNFLSSSYRPHSFRLLFKALRTVNFQGSDSTIGAAIAISAYISTLLGDEKNIIRISLVRGNWPNRLGLLDNKDRPAVASPSTRHRFYVFRNAHTRLDRSRNSLRPTNTWWTLESSYPSNKYPRPPAAGFSISCSKHGKNPTQRY